MVSRSCLAVVVFLAACGVGNEASIGGGEQLSSEQQEARSITTCASVLCVPGYVCKQRGNKAVCVQQAPANRCTTDSDCRAFSDYCTGCDCRALTTTEPDPVCTGPGVRCFADPCMDQVAVCQNGSCALAAAPPPGEACGTKTCPAGEVCCNSSCGICTPPGGFCTQQFCN